MKKEIETEADLNALHDAWAQNAGQKSRLIERIEDLPGIEQVGSAEIDWILPGIFAEGALHMLTSEPGAGKSTWTSGAGYATSLGLDFMGRRTSKRPVLILDAENPVPAIRERFNRLRINTHQDFRVWGQWVGEDPPAAGGAIVLEWVERCNPKPLIIVDSVIAFHPGTENDSNETRKYMAQYRGLTAMGATVVLLHHVGKSETSRDYRGSSDYKASIDIGYKLVNLGDGARLAMLELRPFKQRFSVEPLLHIRYFEGTFSVDEVEAPRSVTESLRELLKENPGITKTKFESLAQNQGLGRNRARDFLENGIKSGTVQTELGQYNRRRHSWVDSNVI